jgi:multiple sugar transport system ATP-binding protein
MGSEVFLYLVTDGMHVLCRADPRTKARAGQEVQVAFDLSGMHAFDPETEQAIPLDSDVPA